jgi:hypothetical protein
VQIEAWVLSLAAEHKPTQRCSQLARVKSVSDSKQSSQAPRLAGATSSNI